MFDNFTQLERAITYVAGVQRCKVSLAVTDCRTQGQWQLMFGMIPRLLRSILCSSHRLTFTAACVDACLLIKLGVSV